MPPKHEGSAEGNPEFMTGSHRRRYVGYANDAQHLWEFTVFER